MLGWRQRRREVDRRGVELGERFPHATRWRRAGLGALACLVLLTLPLAAQETAKTETEAALQARGQAFWEARITEDYAAQYGLLEPKVRRQMSLTDYIQGQGPLRYLEARIEGVQIDEAKAVLTVRTLIRIKHPLLERQKQEMVVQEEWVKRQGEWYRVHPQS
jgi:hypothetical protein